MGDNLSAIEDFNQALQGYFSISHPYIYLCIIHINLGDNQRAVEYLDEYLHLNPNASRYYDRGKFHYQLRNNQAAIEDLTQAIQLNPNFVFAYYSRGNARYDLGDEVGAFEDYNEAEIIKSHLPVCQCDLHFQDQLGYYGIGIALTRLGHHLRAYEALQRAVKLHSESMNQPLYQLIQNAIRNLVE